MNGKIFFREFNISQPDANSRTALHWALDMRKFSRAKILLENGAKDIMAVNSPSPRA